MEYGGRRPQSTHQMDVAMTGDADMERMKNAFLHKDHAFEHHDNGEPE